MTDSIGARYREVVIATSNRGKLIEIRTIMGDLPVSLRALESFPEVQLPEEGEDYTLNARAKALAVARGSGRPALADDSGLEVVGLDGGPGPLSARYGGADLDDAGRVAALLEALLGVDAEARVARFVCVAALATPDGEVQTAAGECSGRILTAPRGGRGFGYDPIFEVEDSGHSMAELPPAKKNRISHRAQAFGILREPLAKLLRS